MVELSDTEGVVTAWLLMMLTLIIGPKVMEI